MTKNNLFKEIMKREAGKSQMKIHHLREAWKHMVNIENETMEGLRETGMVSWILYCDAKAKRMVKKDRDYKYHITIKDTTKRKTKARK